MEIGLIRKRFLFSTPYLLRAHTHTHTEGRVRGGCVSAYWICTYHRRRWDSPLAFLWVVRQTNEPLRGGSPSLLDGCGAILVPVHTVRWFYFILGIAFWMVSTRSMFRFATGSMLKHRCFQKDVSLLLHTSNGPTCCPLSLSLLSNR